MPASLLAKGLLPGRGPAGRGSTGVLAGERVVARTRTGRTRRAPRPLARRARPPRRRPARAAGGSPRGRGQRIAAGGRWRRRAGPQRSRLGRGSLLGGCLLGGLLRRRRIAGRLRGEDLFELADDGGLDGRRCRPDELTHVLELGQNDLALYSELLGELVHPDLSHCSPVPLGPGLVARTVSTSTCSLLRAHRVLVAISSCFRSVSAASETHSRGLLQSCIVPQLADVEAAGEPEGPGQRPSPFGEVQTVQGGVQVRTSPREPAVGVEPGDPLRGADSRPASAGPPPAPGRTEAPCARHPTQVRGTGVDADGRSATEHSTRSAGRLGRARRLRPRGPSAGAPRAGSDRRAGPPVRCRTRCRSATR